MADVSAAHESPAQKKARLQRERRAAKIAAGGAERLRAISALQGGSHRDVQKDVPARPPSDAPRPPSTASATGTPDPDDVDISQHHYTPASQPRLPSPFALDRNAVSTPPLFPAPAQPHDPAADPLVAMMQQMMGAAGGGMPGASAQGGMPGDVPPALANMLSAMSGSAAPEPAPEQSSAWVWRLIHSLFSLCLAVYIVLRTPFTGTKLSRSAAPGDDWMQESLRGDAFAHFFYLFATFEVVLQSSRFFIEKGRLQGTGFLNTVGNFLPEPYAGYVRLVGRYSVIYSTVVSDAMVIVFVLGAAHWWNGDVLA